jgi:hypothetical protein
LHFVCNNGQKYKLKLLVMGSGKYFSKKILEEKLILKIKKPFRYETVS